MFNIPNITTMYKIRLRKAMGGINTDEKMIIEIFCNHTFDQVANIRQYIFFILWGHNAMSCCLKLIQRERIQKAYNNLGNKDLLSDLKVCFPSNYSFLRNNMLRKTKKLKVI